MPMLVLIISSIVLQVGIKKDFSLSFFSIQILIDILPCNKNSVLQTLVQVLNGLTQVLMGPLNLDKEEFKPFLNIVNYISMFLSYGIVGIDAIKAIFFPDAVFSKK